MKTQPILQCKDLWKVFGPKADRFVETVGMEASSEEFQKHDLIVGARDINLEVQKGEIFVIMGLSGSGKSTLLRCMTGLYEPTYGNMYIDGVDISAITAKELVALRRSKTNMVFQDFALLPHLSVLDNIAFPLQIQGMKKSERLEIAKEMADLVGLKGRESYFPDELSGGQQQRVGIARSLTTKPDVWFLDEPFSALDPLIRYEMQGEFLRLQNQLHKSIVFITHDFEEAVRLADRIAIMRNGRIIQEGKPEDLILNPANDYVTEFTQHIPKQKVLRVRAIMKAPDKDLNATNPVNSNDKISDVAHRVMEADGDVVVIDEAHKIVGSIHRLDLLPILI